MADPPATIDNSDKAAEALRFQHQCYLAANWKYFATHNAANRKGAKGYKNFVLLNKDCSPSDLVEHLSAVPGAGAFVNAPPVVLSGLVPQIQIYKVHYETEKSKGDDVELRFTESLSAAALASMANTPETITTGKESRGQGVGIKSFEWTLAGKHPGEANSSIEAKLVLLFSSLEDLFLKQKGKGEQSKKEYDMAWSDLIHPERQYSAGGIFNDKFFRIKAKVGYYPPDENQFAGLPNAKQCKAALKSVRNTSTTLFLTLVEHDLSFSENGQVELELNYQAALEGAMNNPLADVFLLGDLKPEAEADRKAEERRLKGEIGEANRCKGKGVTEKEAESIKEKNDERLKEIENQRRQDRAAKYQKILTLFEQGGKIYNVKIKPEDVGRMKSSFLGVDTSQQLTNEEAAAQRQRNGRPAPPAISAGQPATGSMRNLSAHSAAAAVQQGDGERWYQQGSEAHIDAAQDNAATSSKDLQIDFFYFGDLLEIALQVLVDRPEGGGADPAKEIRPIVSQFAFIDPFSEKEESVNLADVPISVESFKVWFLEKVVKPNRIDYPVKRFINDLVAGLITNALSPKCFGRDTDFATPNVQMNLFTAPLGPKPKSGDRIVRGCTDSRKFRGRISKSQIRRLRENEDSSTFEQINYFIISTASVSAEKLNADATGEDADNDQGRYWLRFGTDQGLVKEIKFKKMDQPGAREMRMEQQGRGGQSHFHEIYNADITMYGCPFFRTGQLVYIDRSSVGIGNRQNVTDIAKKLNLGGYYMVIEVSSSIEAGKFETELKTVWQSAGDGTRPPSRQSNNCAPTQGGQPAGGGGAPAGEVTEVPGGNP